MKLSDIKEKGWYETPVYFHALVYLIYFSCFVSIKFRK